MSGACVRNLTYTVNLLIFHFLTHSDVIEVSQFLLANIKKDEKLIIQKAQANEFITF